MTVAHKCGPSTTVFSQRVSKTKRSGSSDLIRANPGARIDCFRRVASVAQKRTQHNEKPWRSVERLDRGVYHCGLTMLSDSLFESRNGLHTPVFPAVTQNHSTFRQPFGETS